MGRQPVATIQKMPSGLGNQLPWPKRQEQAGSCFQVIFGQFSSQLATGRPGLAHAAQRPRKGLERAGSEGMEAAGGVGQCPSPAVRRGPLGTGEGSRAVHHDIKSTRGTTKKIRKA